MSDTVGVRKMLFYLLISRLANTQTNNLPAISKGKGLYDPVAWSSLRQFRQCPGIDQKMKKCEYPGTPLTGDITWTCPAGQFCVGPERSANCTAGFYCPENSIEAIFCPAGFLCGINTTEAVICPSGRYCPAGTTQSKSCFLASCPQGSDSAGKFLVVLVFALVALPVYFFYRWKGKSDAAHQLKQKGELDGAALQARLSDRPTMDKLSMTFDIEFQDLGLKLKNGVEIMKGVSGCLKSGRTCAVMGPSGAGKTTFVTLLTGKQHRTTGTVRLNGQSDELSKYSKLIGYVPQEDIMIRELTVRDILMHSARMRLPKSWDYPRVKKKVNEIISFLGMAHVANSIIGNEEERGISGGQRKRVNIGMELVAEPSILFLDEPTSGLDSSTSFEVCSMLRNIARQQGLTVAAVIHSPSPATFRQFDDLLLLGKGGQVVYMGPRSDAVNYFYFIGFTMPADESPSDYFMDITSGLVASEYDSAFQVSDLFGYWQQRTVNVFANRLRMTPEQAYQARREYNRLSTKNEESTKKIHLNSDDRGILGYLSAGFIGLLNEVISYNIDLLQECYRSTKSVLFTIFQQPDSIRENQPIYMQLWFLMKRASHQVYRNLNLTLVDLALNFSAGLFISIAVQNFNFIGGNPDGLCAFAPINIQYQCSQPVDQVPTAGMFICLGVLFSGIAISGNTFGREKVVFWRDSASGMSVVPYFLAKILVDIPRIFIGSIVFTAALAMFFPYNQTIMTLFTMVVVLHFYAFALGYALSNAVAYSSLAIYGTGFSLLWALVLSGVIPGLWDIEPHGDSVGYPIQIRWLWDISAPRWMIESFYIQEIQHLPYIEKNSPAQHLYDFSNYYKGFKNSIFITLLWLVIALLALKLFNRRKQK